MACLRETLRDSATIGVEQNSPILTPGRAEGGLRGSHRQIAAGDQLQAGGGGQSVDFGDHRPGMVDDRLHQRRAGAHRLLEERPAAVGIGAMRGHLLEIVAGAEHLAGGGNDDDPHRFVVAGALQRGRQRGHHRDRKGVGGWTRQRQAQNGAILGGDDRIGRGFTLERHNLGHP